MMENVSANIHMDGEIKNVLSALFKAKGDLKTSITPKGKNPYFKNDYITLDDLLKKVDPVCQKYGLGILQFPTGVGLVTLLYHEKSGEYISSYYELLLDNQNPQGVGSALTYAKRQTVQAIFGLSAGKEEDDDGHEASHEEEKPVQGKLTSSSAFQISKVALQEINSLEDLERWKKVQPETVRDNEKVRELVKAKTAELKMAA